MNFFKKLIGQFISTPATTDLAANQKMPPLSSQMTGSRVPQLTANGTGPHADVERELVQLLHRIISDKKIEQSELQELSNWLSGNMQYADDIPAITFLWRFVESALRDGDVESFEWAMIDAAVAKVLPQQRSSYKPIESEEVKTLSATVAADATSVGAEWVVIDTETSGLMNPIYAVEIAAQTMKGFSPIGPSFRVFLNHDVDMEPAAVATHGYTREFLRNNGLPPVEAHCRLAAYAGGLPMVSHNLAYDFRRVLRPEWERLGLAEICPPAFCTVMLSRRCLPEASSVSLASLARNFNLGDVSHQASEDVSLTVKLLSNVLAPRLTTAGIEDVPSVQAFARKTPVASCHELISGKRPKIETPPSRKKRLSLKARRLKKFLQEVLCDGEITNHEFKALQKWIEIEGVTCSEAEQVTELIEKILQDGHATAQELEKLAQDLSRILA
jgi:DNA polymerase III epsilon subunit-like protein